MALSRDVLEQQIQRAFADAPDRPLQRKTHPDSEIDELNAILAGKRWQEAPVSAFVAGYPSIALLPHQAFVDYLPAFLIASLECPPEDLYSISLFERLKPPVKGPKFLAFASAFRSLTSDQREAVAAVLTFHENNARQRNEVRIVRSLTKSLERYWMIPRHQDRF